MFVKDLADDGGDVLGQDILRADLDDAGSALGGRCQGRTEIQIVRQDNVPVGAPIP